MTAAPTSSTTASPARPLIAVPAPWRARHAALLALLEDLSPVEFTDTPGRPLAARVIDAADEASAPAPASSADPAAADEACPCTLILPGAATAAPAAPALVEVTFSDTPTVPWPYRARCIGSRLLIAAMPAVPGANEQVLASDAAGRALWTLDTASGRQVYRSLLPLPVEEATSGAATGQPLAPVAGGDHFIQVLPLFHLVRTVCAAPGQGARPLRASFIVDDPNLHRPTYGYADYRAIARHAEREHYHVGFATIPLDAWYAHRGAVAVFRQHPEQLSLLIHGNDHARDELARADTPAACAQLLRQAITRIQALERRTGLHVCRVMVPPHGACSATMLAQLPGHGFDAMCVSVGSLLACNPGLAWTQALGFAPGELIEGCPVLQRWSLTAVTPDVLLAAAYLGQALILRAHHQDLRNGLEVFGEAARFINSLGAVHWADLGAIVRLDDCWPRRATRPAVAPVPPYRHTQARLVLRRLLTEARDRLRLN